MSFGQLRPIRDDELELMRSWRNAPGVRANMYTRHVISAEEHLAWWRRTCESPAACYRMFERDGLPQGIVGFYDRQPGPAHAFWAFYASPDAAKGTGSVMELCALDLAFGELALRKLSCEVLGFNTGVLRLHEKFGFRTEGVFRQHHPTDGGFEDIHRLALFADEWTARRPAMVERLNKITGVH